jgi:HNH/ENDO VII superfamily nuclease
VLFRFGINVNDPVNGAWLPASEKSPQVNNAVIHSRLHTKAYYSYVNASLENAQSRDQVVRTLTRIRRELEEGTYAP